MPFNENEKQKVNTLNQKMQLGVKRQCHKAAPQAVIDADNMNSEKKSCYLFWIVSIKTE